MEWSGQWFPFSGGWHLFVSDLPEVRAGAVGVPRGSTGRSKSKEDPKGTRDSALSRREGPGPGGGGSQESNHRKAS